MLVTPTCFAVATRSASGYPTDRAQCWATVPVLLPGKLADGLKQRQDGRLDMGRDLSTRYHSSDRAGSPFPTTGFVEKAAERTDPCYRYRICQGACKCRKCRASI